MTTTISVDESTLERFHELKDEFDEQSDLPDHTANSFLSALLDTWEAAGDGYYSDPPSEDVSEQLDRIEAAAREATQAAQNAENAINEVTQR